MLKSIKNDLLYLLGILNAIAKIKKYSKDYQNPEELFEVNQQLNYNACLNLLSFIGENASKLSDQLKTKYEDTEWNKIISLRNRVVHDYQGLDIFLIYKTITEHIYRLEGSVYKILESELKAGNFDKDEYRIAKENKYYEFIDFSKIKF